MKVVSLSLLMLASTLGAFAQHRIVTSPFSAQPESEQTLLQQAGRELTHSVPAMTSADITYFDSTKQTFLRQFPMTQQGLYFISQRFTSPSSETYLDSATIFFPTISTGDIKVDVLRDTTLEINIGGAAKNFHLPNVYAQTFDYIRLDTARYLLEDVLAGTYQSVPFEGKMMPEEFHLQMSARRRSDIVEPAFSLRMSADSLEVTDLTPENSRICFVLIDGSTGVYWERTQSATALFAPNFNMFVSVHYDDATGVKDVASAGDLAITGLYPHPVSKTLAGSPTMAIRLNAPQQVQIAVYDVMGRKVRTAMSAYMPAGDKLVNLPVSGLTPGTYMVRMQGARSVATRTLVIAD